MGCCGFIQRWVIQDVDRDSHSDYLFPMTHGGGGVVCVVECVWRKRRRAEARTETMRKNKTVSARRGRVKGARTVWRARVPGDPSKGLMVAVWLVV